MGPVKPIAVSTTLDDELLQLLARQGRRMPYPVFLAAAMFSWLATDPPGFPEPAALIWLGAVALVLALRMVLLGRLPAMTGPRRVRRLQIAVALSLLNGFTHGTGIVLFAAPSNFQFAIQSLLFVGLCAGSVASTAGYRPVFLGYVLPVITPLIVLWCAGTGQPGSIAVGAAIALFALVLTSLAQDSFRLFRESFDIRSQHVLLNEKLSEALAQAEAASRAKSRFLAAASHDLRQPIHSLSLFSAALALRPLDQSTRAIAHHIERALESLTVQLDALLDISKLDAGVVRSQPVAVDLQSFMTRMQAEFAPIAEARQLQLTLDAPQPASTFVDDVLFGRIVSNLIENAIKYTESGQVKLTVAREHGLVLVAIEDSGRGIDLPEHERVFEEFYQLSNPERDRAKGLGLGLSIVARLVVLLGIRLEMVSHPGRGTSFFLFLPEHDSPTRRSGLSSPITASVARHILVVDDEQAVRAGMQTLLQELGARVSLAGGVAQALELAQRERPDLLLADFRLRGSENGIVLVNAIKALYPDLPAVLISGDTSPERLREAREAGIPILHKPVSLPLLRQTIESASTPGY